jgi:CBS domain-containing protein
MTPPAFEFQEVAMYHRPIREIMQKRRLVTAGEHTTVAEAARLMKASNVGAVVVQRKARLVGIFTERDAVTRVLAAGLDPLHTTLAQVMTPQPDSMTPDKPFSHALVMMHEHGYRHMPVVDRGQVVGVVSMRDARPPELYDLETEVRDRQHIAEILG